MTDRVRETVEIVWGVAKRLIVVIVGIYLIFRFGPYLFRVIRPALICVLIALVMTYALLPWVDWLCRKQWARVGKRPQRLIATVVVFVIFLGTLGVTIGLFVNPIRREVASFVENFEVYKVRIDEFAGRVGSWYARDAPDYLKKLIERMDYSKLTDWVTGYVQGVPRVATSSIGFLIELVLVPVLAFYFIWDGRNLTREFYGLVPSPRRREAVRIGNSVGGILESYIFGQLILCAIAAVLTGAFLAALGVPYVVVLALFAGITRAVPVIGPIVSGVPIVLVGLLKFDGLGVPLLLLAFVVVMHFAESKFIMPLLIGERLKLHPATVIIVLLIGAQLFGVIGMFLAAPVAAVVRELIRAYYIRPRRQPESAPILKTQRFLR